MFHFITQELLQGKRLTLATVIARAGSGPREPGAMMVIPEGDPTHGTVGGGLLEARTLAAAQCVFAEGRSRLLSFDLSAPVINETGMICGGRVEILVAGLDGNNPEQTRIFEKLDERLNAGKVTCLLTSIRASSDEDAVETGFGLAAIEECDWGSLEKRFWNTKDIKDALRSNEPALIQDGDARCFVQPVHPPRHVYIAGAGHVGSALAEICFLLELSAIVIDDRDDYACRKRFPHAEKIHLISSYADALSGLNIRAEDAIVIATRSHLSDHEVLAGALRTKAGYIGMIASRRKREMIYSALSQQGFHKEDLARIHSPIGLDIGAKTPAEIAVSIAAEIIVFNNQQEKR